MTKPATGILGNRLTSRPDQLSGGQQQRVAIARASGRALYWPMSWRATSIPRRRTRSLRQVADEWGRAVVIVLHDARIAAYADRIVLLRDGAIVDETRLDPGGQNVGSAGLVADKMKKMN